MTFPRSRHLLCHQIVNICRLAGFKMTDGGGVLINNDTDIDRDLSDKLNNLCHIANYSDPRGVEIVPNFDVTVLNKPVAKEKVIIDYVISFEDGKYLVMKLYEDRQWDTVHTYDDPKDAIQLMHDMLKAMKNECCPPAYWR